VAQTFLTPGLEQSFRLDAVVTVVDSANIETWLAQNPIAGEQIRAADLLVINKLDLVTSADVDRIKARLVEINDRVRSLPSINGVVPIKLLLDIDAHQAPDEHDQEREQHEHQDHHHGHAQVHSVSFADDIELDYDKFDRFVRNLPDAVYRAKGTVAIHGLNRRVIFHRVGGRNVLDQGEPWEGEQRSCRAVLLGKEFDGDKLLALLRNCAAKNYAKGDPQTARQFN